MLAVFLRGGLGSEEKSPGGSKSPSCMTANVRPDAINSGMNFGKYIYLRNEKTFVFDTCDHAFNAHCFEAC